jgi:hypothetical protein
MSRIFSPHNICVADEADNDIDFAFFVCDDEEHDDMANEKLRNLYACKLEWPSYCCCADYHRMQRPETFCSADDADVEGTAVRIV